MHYSTWNLRCRATNWIIHSSVDLVRRGVSFFFIKSTDQPLALGEGFADHSAVAATRTADSASLTAAVNCGQYKRHASSSITNGTVAALPSHVEMMVR